MKCLIFTLLTAGSLFSISALGLEPLKLTPGYVYRLTCPGRLLVSAVGNDSILRLEALPKELGCGAILKPVSSSGTTNLILETSAGTIERLIQVSGSFGAPKSTQIDLGASK